jgi:hypothetical protein
MRTFNGDKVYGIAEVVLVRIDNCRRRFAGQAVVETMLKRELARLQANDVVRNRNRIVIFVTRAM